MKWQPTPVFLPVESHGQGSLAGYSPWGQKESDMTESTEHTSQPMGPCAPARLEGLMGVVVHPRGRACLRLRGSSLPARQAGNGRPGGSGGGKRDEGRDARGRKHGAEPAGERRGAWGRSALVDWWRDTAGRLPSPSEPRRRRLQNWADIVPASRCGLSPYKGAASS